MTATAGGHGGRVCVLGAGLAGLAAARDLANAGRTVIGGSIQKSIPPVLPGVG